MNNGIILETQNVVKKFGGLVAVKNVSLKVKKGEILGIIGPNGAGKTTFLNCISGFFNPEEGQIIFKGNDIAKSRPYYIARKGIARTFQITHPFPEMTVLESVKVGVVFGNSTHFRDNYKKAQEVLDFINFPVSYDTLTKNLNTFEMKILELARALATNPDLLLLDETAAGLTPGELSNIIELVKKIRNNGVSIITIEHVMKFIMTLCDRITVLNYGEKIAEGTPEEIVNNKLVLEAYLGKKYAEASK